MDLNPVIAELFKAAFLAGIPVGVTSFALVWWALRSDYLTSTTSLKALEKEVSLLSKANSNKKKKKKQDLPEPRKLNPVHNKWLKFGGGFYGVVALMTFVIIEVGEIASFLGNFRESIGLFSNLGLNLVINFFIDAVMNFVAAISWPWYWMQEIRSDHIWVWFLAAYGGYWLGARAALKYRNQGGTQS